MRVMICPLALIIGVCSPAMADPSDAGFRKLRGLEIKRAFTGKTFSDGVHFAFRYSADGRIQGTGMGAKVQNRWRIAKDDLCVTDSLGETCHAVWKNGRALKLIIGDQDLSIDGSLN